MTERVNDGTVNVDAPLPLRLLEHVRQTDLFPAPGVALLAVSGGPDSVALLLLISDVASELGLAVAVAHVDHGIASDSAEVAGHVAALAGSLGVPFFERRLGLASEASETKAREARYAALRHMQHEAAARYLVTAHQRDDQVETVLYRALRGSGMAGLAGIPPAGPNGLVRPLLPFSREELEAWLGQRSMVNGQQFTVHRDSANFDVRHDRSWLRHAIVPLLVDRFGDDAGRQLERLARHASHERDAWAALLRALPELEFRGATGVVEVARPSLLAYDKTLCEALLRALAREVGAAWGEKRAARVRQFAARASSGRRLAVGGGYDVEVAFDRLRVIAPRATDVPNATQIGGGGSGAARWGSWRFRWRGERAGQPDRVSRTTWVTPGATTVRALAGGESVVPFGGIGHRKVRRLLMEARVPASERDAYPLCTRDGDVIWIPGVCRAESDVPAPGAPALRIDADVVER